MAKRVEGVTERLLAVAREEFLERGYEGASLRRIAERAGSSKGAIYIRYADKAELYAAVVMPSIDGLCDYLETVFNRFGDIPADQQTDRMDGYADTGIDGMVDYLYDHFEVFRIVVTSGEADVYRTFIDRMVELDTKTTYRYLDAVGSDAVESGRLTPEMMHMINTSYFTGILEVVEHGMEREAAKDYVTRLCAFYRAGWNTVFYSEYDPDAGIPATALSAPAARDEASELIEARGGSP